MKGILVNIFGGIMRCDIIAEGIVAAAREVDLERAAGGPARRHQRRSRARTSSPTSGLPIIAANDLGDAAKKIVAEVKAAGRCVTPSPPRKRGSSCFDAVEEAGFPLSRE